MRSADRPGGRRRLAAAALALALCAPAAALAAAAGPARVAAVEFSPVERLGPYRFADFVVARAGDAYAPDLLERSLRLLRETGLFAEVQGEALGGPGGTRLRFEVRPLPLVKSVRVRGNFLMLERNLVPVLRLRAAEPYREETVRGDVERILRHYEEEGFAGTRVVEEVVAGDGEVSVAYRISEGSPQVVREVRLRAGRALAAREVLAALGVPRYTFYRAADLQHGLERVRDLYQTRGFLDARVTSSVASGEGVVPPLTVFFNPIKGLLTLRPGGYRVVTITIEVEEGRRYEVIFRGLVAFGEGALRPLLTFPRTGFFDEEEVAASRGRILAFYQERGYYLAEVDAQADYDAGSVVFTVREGKPVSVGSVRLRGVTHFSGDWVRSRLAVRESGPENPRLLRAAELEQDRRRIESWYREQGYTQVEVPPPEVWPDASPAGAEVTFRVREGVRTLVRYLAIEGATALPAARLREAVGLREGEPFQPASLAAAEERIRAAYARAGYPRAVVAARADLGDDKAAADVRIAVVEGRPRRLGAVAVTGNGKTKRRVLLRELPLVTGDPFDAEALAVGRGRLYDLGIFREVRFLFPEPVADGEPQDLVLAVRERPTGFVGFGGGFASDERYRGFVEVGDQNLFGTGRGARVKSKLSSIGYRHDLFYQEPWMLDFDVQGQVDLYVERRDEIGYEVLRRGVTLGVNRALSRRLLLNLRYRYEFVDYRDVVPDLVAEEGPLESLNISSLLAVLEYDRRDNPIMPRRGSFHLASVEAARPAFGGDTSFTKYQVETSWYQPLGAGAELALGLRGGFTQLILGSGGLPLAERFFLGGDRSVRGYAYKGIGPKDASGNPLGGTIFALGSLEGRFTLKGKLRGVLFVDAGELWADAEGQSSSGLKAAAGVGLRYDTLVGPIRLDWGHKLEPETGESSSRWHLTIGYPF